MGSGDVRQRPTRVAYLNDFALALVGVVAGTLSFRVPCSYLRIAFGRDQRHGAHFRSASLRQQRNEHALASSDNFWRGLSQQSSRPPHIGPIRRKMV